MTTLSLVTRARKCVAVQLTQGYSVQSKNNQLFNGSWLDMITTMITMVCTKILPSDLEEKLVSVVMAPTLSKEGLEFLKSHRIHTLSIPG